MRRKLILGAIYGLFAISAFAMPTEGNFLEPEELRIKQLTHVAVEPGDQADSLFVDFSVSYSNSCMAGAEILVPKISKTFLSGAHGETVNRILVVVETRPSKIRVACPMVYRPVSQTYRTVIKGLIGEGSYKVVVSGVNTKSGLAEFKGRLAE